ncbi:unnamed protein product, partial [Polarella glacialis]
RNLIGTNRMPAALSAALLYMVEFCRWRIESAPLAWRVAYLRNTRATMFALTACLTLAHMLGQTLMFGPRVYHLIAGFACIIIAVPAALLVRGACFRAKTEDVFALMAASAVYLCVASSNGQIVEARRFDEINMASLLFKMGTSASFGLTPAYFAALLTITWISDFVVVFWSFEALPEGITDKIFVQGMATCCALCISMLQ